MTAAMTEAQKVSLERVFGLKSYKFNDPVAVARAHTLAQQLQITPEAFANQYDSYALVSDWSMEVTAQRLKAVADYLQGEQRKENARPRPAGGAGAGATAGKGLPQAMRPTWEDLPEKLDFPTPAAKRQALDPAALNPPGSAAARAGSGSAAKPAATPGSAVQPVRGTPLAAATQPKTLQGLSPAAGLATPGAPASAFAQRTNRGQVVAVLHDHLPGPAAAAQRGGGGVVVRPVGQPPLSATGHLFMVEVLETKIHALDERIMDFADALTAAVQSAQQQQSQPAATPTPPAAGGASTPGPPPAATPGPFAPTPTPTATPTTGGPQRTPLPGHPTPANGASTDPTDDAVPQPLSHSVSEITAQPVWVAGRVLAEVEGAPLNVESLVLEGCREASGGARVRLDVSGVAGFRLFPGQSICAYGLNPTGHTFMAQRIVTHVPPPPLPYLSAAGGAAATAAASGRLPAGAPDAAARQGGLSLVVAAGPYSLAEDLSYSPLDELLEYCSAHPPDVLLLLGPFVDAEHPAVASGLLDAPYADVMRERVAGRLAAWRTHGSAGGGTACSGTTIALMPAVRDVTALPVLPQPPMELAAPLAGDKQTVCLQNPCTAALGPLLLAAGSADLLRALSGAELARVPPGPRPVERLPALAGHVLGQRSLYPLYPAPLGACLDTTHYPQLGLPALPDLLLLPSDLAPFAKLLQPAAWADGAPPGLAAEALLPGGVAVLNPGRLARGSGGGTFAHVSVAPGPGPVVERMRVEVKRV